VNQKRLYPIGGLDVKALLFWQPKCNLVLVLYGRQNSQRALLGFLCSQDAEESRT